MTEKKTNKKENSKKTRNLKRRMLGDYDYIYVDILIVVYI